MVRQYVRVEGLRELDKALTELAAEIGPRKGRTILRQSLQDIGKPIADAARGMVRVDQGALRDSIKVGGTLSRSQRGKHKKESDVEVFVGPSGLPQSISEEFGTFRQAPHPYLRPAWEQGKERALETFKTGMWQRIERAARRLAKQRAEG